ncbi:MAG: OmpA family protein [Lewinellaceae bacterium]|nr:OmpA family protein [Lewinellaceae bacterium]
MTAGLFSHRGRARTKTALQLLAWCFCLCLSLPAFSQNGSKINKWIERGRDLIKARQFEQAETIYLKIIQEDTLNGQAWLDLGGIYQQLGKYPEAIASIRKGLELEYDPQPQYYLALGDLYYHEQEFEKAKQSVQAFLKSGEGQPQQIQAAQEELHRLELILDGEKLTSSEMEPLPDNINTPYLEYLPAITAFDRLIFTRRVGARELLLQSQFQDTVWSNPQPVFSWNTRYDLGGYSITPGGNRMVVTVCFDPSMHRSCDLFLLDKTSSGWDTPHLLMAPVNTEFWESQPSISSDGQTIYFSSNRPGGLGGSDIWMTFWQDSFWSAPVNLGAPVNTPGNEVTPFIHADDQTLYFASDGLFGLGAKDLFVSRKDSTGNWSEPKNLGYPVNTKGDDSGLTIQLDGKWAYLSTDRFTNYQNKQGQLDIYRFHPDPSWAPQPMTFLHVALYSAVDSTPVYGNVEVYRPNGEKAPRIEPIDSTHAWFACLPAHTTFGVYANVPNWLPFSGHVDLTPQQNFYEPVQYVVYLQPVRTTNELDTLITPVILHNIFFATGSAELLDGSAQELSRLKAFLLTNPDIRIEIRGHTDNTGSDSINMELSSLRAQAVYNYLINEGISSSRLAFRGYGASRPIASNDTAEGRQQNRRTEFIVLK